MALVIDLLWDGLVFLVGFAVLVYLYRAKRLFAGGQVARILTYFMAAMFIACTAFGARIALDLANINPNTFLVSVRDLGTAVVLFVILLGLREGAKLWTAVVPR